MHTVPTTLPSVLARTIRTAVQYVQRTAIRTYGTADVHIAPTICTHVLHLLMYVLHVPTADARTYVEEKQPSSVSSYRLHLPGTRVPTDVSTHLLHVLLFLLMDVRTHRTCCFNKCYKYTPTAQNRCTCCCTHS